MGRSAAKYCLGFGLIIVALAIGIGLLTIDLRPRTLHDLVKSKNLLSLEAALYEGHDPNRSVSWGDPPKRPGVTPLMLAAGNGFIDGVRLLLHHGADTEYQDFRGWRAVHYGVHHPDVLRTLIDAGACADATDKNGISPFCLAARSGNLDSLMLLVHIGMSESDMCCALTEAARFGHIQVLLYLLEDVIDAGDSSGRACLSSALHEAEQRGFEEAVAILSKNESQ